MSGSVRGPVASPGGTEMFHQGPLRVIATEDGWSVVIGDRVRADVTRALAVSIVIADDSADTRYLADGVAVVVAQSIVERVGGWFHVHAGLLADGTLIVGESGAGKTTTTLALAAASRLVTDDVVFAREDAGVVNARCFRRPLHVGETTMAMFPELRARVLPGLSLAGKAIVSAEEVSGPELIAVARIVFPEIDRAATTTTATAIDAAAALPRLLRGSAMVTWPGLPRAQEHMAMLGMLARLPAVRLVLGADAARHAQRIREVLSTVTRWR